MSFFNKMKAIGEHAVQKANKTTNVIAQSYKENGMEGVGKVIGCSTKQIIDSSTKYVEQISRENKKASRPIGITYKKGDPTKLVATCAIEAINTIRTVSLDIKDGYDNLGKTKSNNESSQSKNLKP